MIDQAEGGGRRASLGHLVIAASLVLLGIFMLWETFSIPVAVTYARVGPRLFPGLVAGGLILNGLWLALEARHAPDPIAMGEPPVYWPAVAWVSAGILLEAALLERIGFVLSATLLFTFTARGFGSRAALRDAAIGFVLSLIAYLGFTYGLDLNLPKIPLLNF
jgi:putative tricarboxylic transport membrane protein